MKLLRVVTGVLAFCWSMPVQIARTSYQDLSKLPEKAQNARARPKQLVQTNIVADSFQEYKALSTKVLYTADEQIRLRVFLSNPELIERAYLDLLNTNSQDEIRFERLDYFEKAIAWAENPARAKIVNALKDILLKDNFSNLDSVDQRKSIAGDKIEIYTILKQFEPAALQEIVEVPKDARIDKVIAYAENIHKSHRGAINL